ncbi:hypothetical protein CEUSTIGMA_g6624.t1 [Chlamydomonas eustigma]|uniref:Kinesin-like protein n=1 Tax=Chlamydomonas eustigma TaxID=1157962 RepID=A0A250X7X4_9CHLO|nr:hypothetical protein CEUSTIGMA_g6624.t1 [Chlamydomonas eustigma]|eukprot:GAX79184.1 hypothetical protein CEUSTIGMA_g6624.t1 [Chlamydomonas eustigma]
MVKTNVKVYVRTRPTSSTYDGIRVQQDASTIHIKIPKSEEMGLINNQQENFSFKFDGILENVSQDNIYTTTTHEVVDSLLSGINGTVFCYGQTGAGKTFTMSGDLRHFQRRGLIPQAIHHIFRDIDMRVDKMYTVHVSYLEIYNDQMYDLLSDKPGSNESLAILEDSHGGSYVRGLTKVKVHSEEEALMQYFAGDQGRSTAGHILNTSSSRSHTVFTLHLEMRTSEAASERAVLSKLNLVDLAGSERTKKTGVTGQTMIEAQFINRSLSFLEQTVNALSKKENHVPYRQSKLTSVLRDALGGNCKTIMIANIYGEPSHVSETLSTLRFASRVRTLVTDVGVNESSDPLLLLRRYERQIKELKQELAMRDALSGRGRISYDDMSDAEVRELNALAKKFLSGNTDVEELPCETVKSIREAYKQMRAVYQAVSTDLREQLQRSMSGLGAVAPGQGASGTEDNVGKVGEVERGGRGFAVGTAPIDAKPQPGDTTRPSTVKSQRPSVDPPGGAEEEEDSMLVTRTSPPRGRGGSRGASSSAAAGGGVGMTVAERNATFLRFKKELDEGRGLQAVVLDRTAHLTELKKSIKEVSSLVNSTKYEIDTLTEQLGAKKALSGPATTSGEETVLDSEQYSLIKDLKAAKLRYRTEFDRLKELRSELDPAMVAVAEAKQNLVDEFNRWVGSPQGLFTLSQDEDDAELDAGEAFEKMQVGRIMAKNPESSAFHAARRKMGGNSPNRYHGVKAAAEATRRLEYEKAIAAGLARG